MNHARFVVLLLALTGVGLGLWRWQDRQLKATQVALEARRVEAMNATQARASLAVATPPANPAAPSPSMELLRLRAEVTRLRSALDRPADAPARRAPLLAEAWNETQASPRPSQCADYVSATQVADVGFGSPENALLTFHYAMSHQTETPITPTRMKDLWVVPDDFDAPNARYSIDLGEGLSGHVGYRVLSLDPIGTGEVRLTIDYEREDGSTFLRERILVGQGDHWRLKPKAVTRAPPLDAQRAQ